MKSFLFAILLCGASAFASDIQFQIISGQIAHAHGGPHGIGTISVDYTQNQATLTVDPNHCPPQQVCTLEYRPLIVRTLPIVSVQEDDCHIKTVVAQQDQRPVDGIFEKLTVEDFSGNTCPTFTEIIGKAEYQTTGYNRLQGREFDEISKFDTKYVMPSAKTKVLVERIRVVAFAPPEYAGKFSLQILKDGTIQHVNNKGQVKVDARLSADDLAKIQKLVADLQEVKLVLPDGFNCMDAPSSSIIAHQAQQDITIWRDESCRQTTTDNQTANDLIALVQKIDSQYRGR